MKDHLRRNVVQLFRQRPRTLTSAEKMLEEIRASVHRIKGPRRLLAEEIGVATSTIGNIAIGKTKWPRHTTLFPLMTALGLKLQLVHTDKGGVGDTATEDKEAAQDDAGTSEA